MFGPAQDPRDVRRIWLHFWHAGQAHYWNAFQLNRFANPTTLQTDARDHNRAMALEIGNEIENIKQVYLEVEQEPANHPRYAGPFIIQE